MQDTQPDVLTCAKRCAPPDRIGWFFYWVNLWVAFVWSFGFPAVLLPREDFEVTYYGGTIGFLLVAWAIYRSLKQRQAVQ